MSLDYHIKKGAIMGTGNVTGMAEAIRSICDKGKDFYSAACRKRAEDQFDKDMCFDKYVELYEGGEATIVL